MAAMITTEMQADAAPATIKVWDLAVRVFHWSLVASFAVAWLTSEGMRDLHYWAGYAAAGLIAFRLLWGIIGTRRARFADFVRSPKTIVGYIGDVVRGRERRYVGHNPAGGAMIVALLIALAGLCLTGWMQTTDAYWGVRWVREAHGLLSSLLLILIGLHIAGVIVASLRHRENLARAMITGRKRAAEGDDIG